MPFLQIPGAIALCSVSLQAKCFWCRSQHEHISDFCFFTITEARLYDSIRDTLFYFLGGVTNRITGALWSLRFRVCICTIFLDLLDFFFFSSFSLELPVRDATALSYVRPCFQSFVLLKPDILSYVVSLAWVIIDSS